MATFAHPSLRTTALGIGLGRSAIGVAALAAPVAAVQVVGLDRGTAVRVSWLSRMAAGRDLALGAGTTLAVLRSRPLAPWLIAGAACDAIDAHVINGAGQRRLLDRRRSTPGALLAAGAAIAGLAVAAIDGAERRLS